MFYTYAEKQSSTIWGEWKMRLVAFDTMRRYVYYSEPLPSSHSTAKTKAAAAAAITMPRATSSPSLLHGHDGVTDHHHGSSNNSAATTTAAAATSSSSRWRSSASEHGVATLPAVAASPSALSVADTASSSTTMDESNNNNNNSISTRLRHHRRHHRDAVTPPASPHRAGQSLTTPPAAATSQSPLPQQLLQATATQPEPAPTTLPPGVRWKRKIKLTGVLPQATVQDFTTADPHLIERDFYQLELTGDERSMAKAEIAPPGPLLCASAAPYVHPYTPQLYSHNNNNNSNSSLSSSGSNGSRDDEDGGGGDVRHVHSEGNNGSSRDHRSNSSSTGGVVARDDHDDATTTTMPPPLLQDDVVADYDDEYVRDGYRLRDLYDALREQYVDLERDRRRAARDAVAHGRAPPPKSLTRTLASPRSRMYSMAIFPYASRVTFTLRCRNECEMRRLWYVLQMVLGYDGLEVLPYRGLPPYDPRNGLLFAHVPMLLWQSFAELDKAVFYTFIRGDLMQITLRSDSSNNSNSSSGGTHDQHSSKRRGSKATTATAASSAAASSSPPQPQQTTPPRVQLDVWVHGAYLCLTHDMALFVRDTGTIACWLRLSAVRALHYHAEGATPYVVFLSDRPSPDVVFVPQPPAYGAAAQRDYRARYDVQRIHCVMHDLCYASRCAARRVVALAHVRAPSAAAYVRDAMQRRLQPPLSLYPGADRQGALRALLPKETLAAVWAETRREALRMRRGDDNNNSSNSAAAAGGSAAETQQTQGGNSSRGGGVAAGELPAIPLYDSTAAELCLRPSQLRTLERVLDEARESISDVVGMPLQRAQHLRDDAARPPARTRSRPRRHREQQQQQQQHDAAAAATATSTASRHDDTTTTTADVREVSILQLLPTLPSGHGGSSRSHVDDAAQQQQRDNDRNDHGRRRGDGEHSTHDDNDSHVHSRSSSSRSRDGRDVMLHHDTTAASTRSRSRSSVADASASSSCSNDDDEDVLSSYVRPGSRYITREELNNSRSSASGGDVSRLVDVVTEQHVVVHDSDTERNDNSSVSDGSRRDSGSSKSGRRDSNSSGRRREA